MCGQDGGCPGVTTPPTPGPVTPASTPTCPGQRLPPHLAGLAASPAHSDSALGMRGPRSAGGWDGQGSAEANSLFLHSFFFYFFHFLLKAVLHCSFLEPLQDNRHPAPRGGHKAPLTVVVGAKPTAGQGRGDGARGPWEAVRSPWGSCWTPGSAGLSLLPFLAGRRLSTFAAGAQCLRLPSWSGDTASASLGLLLALLVWGRTWSPSPSLCMS